MTPEQLLTRASSFVFTPVGTARDFSTRMYQVQVSWRGENQWSVKHFDLIWDGEGWEYEPLNSSQHDAFRARTRFTLEQACVLAERLVDLIENDGFTWAQLQVLKAARAAGQ